VQVKSDTEIEHKTCLHKKYCAYGNICKYGGDVKLWTSMRQKEYTVYAELNRVITDSHSKTISVMMMTMMIES
jgi:hypothetical protein